MPVGIELFVSSSGKYGIGEPQQYRRNKGQSLIEFPCNYTIIDIETSGLSPMYDEIIELSALKVQDNEIVDEFSSLVKPDYKIDSFITELTGITNDMLKNAPKINKILPEFINFISDDKILGYNINFDINFIYDDLKRYFGKDFKNNFIDLMRICKKAYSFENYKLKTVAQNLNISIDGHHRGLNDCRITFDIYNKVFNDVSLKYPNILDFKKTWYQYQKAYDIKANVGNIDETNFFYKKMCVFTGTLNIARKDAMQLIVNMGGLVSDTLNKETNLLIVGTQDYKKTKENGKSNKMLKAEKYILKGQDLQIIPEDEFYKLIKEQHDDEDDDE